MAIYEAVIYIGLMLGSFTSGYIYSAYESSTLIFFISSMSILWATLIVIFLIPESLNARPHTNYSNLDETHSGDEPQQQHQQAETSQNAENRFRKLFDSEHLKAMYETCFKPREFETRLVIFLIVGCLLTCAFVVGKN